MDKSTADVVARKLMANDFMKKGWSHPTLAFWLQHDCKCIYCECDLSHSRDVAYYGYCAEHILPKSKYAELASAEWNTALACSSCNRLKARWDPNKSGEIVYTGDALNQEQVTVLISRSRERIQGLRKEAHATV
jgi:5-methylcytosine-specific restriction endonuclease McrA